MANRQRICAGNWKMYKTPDETRAFMQEWRGLSRHAKLACQILIFPPAYNLPILQEESHALKIEFGPQNVCSAKEGAFTGELSPFVVQQMGARYALIGHSERRTLFAETDQLIAQKVKTTLESHLIPMLCVGETRDERESGRTLSVLERQLRQGLVFVPPETLMAARAGAGQVGASIVIAYEPVWAIGTGLVATPEMAEQTHAAIRNILASIYGADLAAQISILYGGSVKPENASGLARQPNIDGFLVGGASLKAADFIKIAQAM